MVVLWIAHTHALESADATPYLAISSPEKQSGKTRLLECLALLANGASGIAVAPTASTIFRTREATPDATLLLDELDAVFRDRSDRYEEVRAVINAGHRRGATVRSIGSGFGALSATLAAAAAGPIVVSARFTPAAHAHGLALGRPQVVMARPTGVGRALATYSLPIEGRDEWLAAARRLA